jgi:cytoskeletal protein CcmA (bactofilin family)
VFWKRQDEPRGAKVRPQREWTTGEAVSKPAGPTAPTGATPQDPAAPKTRQTPAETAAAAPPPTSPGTTEVLARVPVLRPALGPDTSVTGRLSFTMPTRIDGKLRGEVHATDMLLIGAQGYVEGLVRTPRLIVQGEVRGDVRGAERVEIATGGRLMGSVETYSLVVEDGGYLDGDCRIAPPRATVRPLRPAQAG